MTTKYDHWIDINPTARILFPDHEVRTSIVTQEEFDEFDTDRLGEHTVIFVSAEEGARSDAGMREVLDAGYDLLSPEAMPIMWRAVHGDAPMSEAALERVEFLRNKIEADRRRGDLRRDYFNPLYRSEWTETAHEKVDDAMQAHLDTLNLIGRDELDKWSNYSLYADGDSLVHVSTDKRGTKGQYKRYERTAD